MTKVITKNMTEVITKDMKKTFSKTSIRAIALSFLFLFSSVGASVLINPAAASPNSAPAATPLTSMEANWAYPNGNQFAQNYNPQNQINSSNAQNLGLAWLFPLPGHPASLLSVSGGLSVGAAPLIINGTIYAISQFYQVFALNVANGNVLWTDVIPINANSTIGQGTGAIRVHNHDGTQQYTTALFNHTPTLWYQGGDNKVWAINALNGKYELNFTDFTGINMVDGNNPVSIYNGVGAANIIVDQNKGILISSHGAESIGANGRCFYRGWNVLVSPPAPLWTTYCTPPQPGSNVPVDPNWTINQVKSMRNAEIFYCSPSSTAFHSAAGGGCFNGGMIPNDHGQAVVNLKTLSPSVLNSTLYNDWGYVNQSPACLTYDGGGSPGSTGAGWAGAWILGSGPSSGMVFVNTNNKDPFGGGACVPGPDLWSASKLALNETTGAWIWGLQNVAHDLWDYDCSWWQALANETISGVNTQVVISTCKSGYVFVQNAVTGDLIYAWTAPLSTIWRCPICYGNDPTNKTLMSLEFANPTGADFLANLGGGYSEIEAESAYSPATNMFYIPMQNGPAIVHHVQLNHTTYFTINGLQTLPPPGATSVRGPWDNTTLFAIHADTGQIAWTHFVPIQGYRGGITVTGNVVFMTLSYGDIVMLNAQTGALIRDFYIGGPLNVLPSIGATASGQMMVIFPIDAGLVTWGTGVPGDIVALNLQAPATTTATTTATLTNTITTTATVGGATTTVTAGGKTTTVTGAGATTTVTSTAAGGGVSTTTLYGVAAIAVILAISTGYLAMRGRKPAS